ncbi:MAG: DUF3631 domain-containing protein [Actinomycetota bacterium]
MKGTGIASDSGGSVSGTIRESDPDLLRVAVHEAAHVVAAVMFDRPFRLVTIVPHGDSDGHVEQVDRTPQEEEWLELAGYRSERTPEMREWLESEVMTRLVGAEAVVEFCGGTQEEAGLGVVELEPEQERALSEKAGAPVGSLADPGGDLHAAMMLVDRISDADAEVGPYLEWLRQRTLTMIRNPLFRELVEEIASELVRRKTLSSADIRAVIGRIPPGGRHRSEGQGPLRSGTSRRGPLMRHVTPHLLPVPSAPTVDPLRRSWAVDPWPDRVDGAAILDEVVRVVRRFVVQPEGQAVAEALWIAHTWFIGAMRVSPILTITSPTKRCGKSTLLGVVRALVPRPLATANITPAATYPLLDQEHPTLLIDEGDTFLKASQDLRGILNAGHVRGAASVVRASQGPGVDIFNVFGAKALALIGKAPPTIADRSIEISLTRSLPGERVERVPLDLELTLVDTRRRLDRWANDDQEQIASALEGSRASRVDLLGRDADNWEGMHAIAEACGSDWSARAATAARSLVPSEDDDPPVAILRVLGELMDRSPSGFVSSRALAGAVEEGGVVTAEGGRVTTRSVALHLSVFGIRPRSNGTLRGYQRNEDLDETLRRWRP